jgi:hypothetical protein
MRRALTPMITISNNTTINEHAGSLNHDEPCDFLPPLRPFRASADNGDNNGEDVGRFEEANAGEGIVLCIGDRFAIVILFGVSLSDKSLTALLLLSSLFILFTSTVDKCT